MLFLGLLRLTSFERTLALRAGSRPRPSAPRRSNGAITKEAEGMFAGVLEIDLLLGDVHSLKEKRSLIRPLISDVRKRFEVSVAEAGHLELHRRALIGVAVVAAEAAHCVEVLEACEQLVAARPEIEVLSTRQRLFGEEDE
jgi:uncharacterized protein